MLLFLSLLAFQTRIMATKAVGLTTGIFLTALFSIRFTLEFIKTKQEEYDPLIEGLTTGQLLSIPAVLVGIAMIYLSFRNRKKPASPTS
jgi:prolipoprotein diacylglyceryltransferase